MMLFITVGHLLECFTPNDPLFSLRHSFLILFWIIGLITETLSGNFCWLNFNAISFLTYESRKALIKKDEDRQIQSLSDLRGLSLYLDFFFIDYF